MKKTLYSILTLTILIGSYEIANGQNCKEYKWSASDESITAPNSRDVQIASDGSNVVAAGTYSSSTLDIGTVNLTNSGGADVFVVKFDGNGNELWGTGPSGSGNDFGRGVATNASGNVVVAGHFESDTLDFTSTALFNSGTATSDAFVAGYNSSGAVQWAYAANGTGADMVNDVAIDASGNAYICGAYTSSNLIVNNTINNSFPTRPDMYVAKVNSGGAPDWVASTDFAWLGGRNEEATGVAVDASGNVYICGYFDSDWILFGTDTLHNSGMSMTADMFIAKFDATGAYQWSRSGGGQNADRANDIAVDASGNIYVTGYFSLATATFGSITLTNSDFNFTDMFLLQYDSSGTIQWAKNGNGNNDEIAFGCTVDNDGDIHVTGFFSSGALTFGTFLIGGTAAAGDMFWAEFDNTGQAKCAMSSNGDTGPDFGYSVAADDSGNSYVAGAFISGNISFGTEILNNTDSLGAMYVVQIGDTATTPPSGIVSLNTRNTSVYPNPTTGLVNIDLDGSKEVEVSIYNMLGEMLHAEVLTSNGVVDLSSLERGVYIMTLRNEAEVRTERITLFSAH